MELEDLSKEFVRGIAEARGLAAFVDGSAERRAKSDLIIFLRKPQSDAGARHIAGDIDNERRGDRIEGGRNKMGGEKRRGIYNWDNTCYLGSVLQVVVDMRGAKPRRAYYQRGGTTSRRRWVNYAHISKVDMN